MITKDLSLLLRLRESASGLLSWTSAVLLHCAHSFDCWKPFTSYLLQVHIFLLFPPLVAFPKTALCISRSQSIPYKSVFPRYLLVLFFPHITLSWAPPCPCLPSPPLYEGRSTCQSSLQGPERKDHPYSSELIKWLRLAYLNCSPCPTLTFSWPCLSTNTVSEPLQDQQGPSLYGTCECLNILFQSFIPISSHGHLWL